MVTSRHRCVPVVGSTRVNTQACVDDLSKLAAARLSLTSALGDGGNNYEGEVGRVAAAVAATCVEIKQ